MSSLLHRLCRRVLVSVMVAHFAFASGQTPSAPKSNSKPDKKAQPQATSAPKKRVVIDLSGFDLLEPEKVEKQAVVAGATRGMPAPVALAPRLARLYSTNPTLNWRFDGKADKFLVVIRDDAQNEVFRDETSGSSYSYPASAPHLEPGRTCFWTVEVSAPFSLSEASSPAGFVVVSATQDDDLHKRLSEHAGDSYDEMKARAQVLVDSRLWYDVLAAYSELAARYPQRAEVYESRGNVYAQLAVTQTLADQDFARADSLKAHVRDK